MSRTHADGRANLPSATQSPFGASPDGDPVDRWRLDSGTGVAAEILSYGGILHALELPGEAGERIPLVLSLTDVASYAELSPYFGAIVGRYANRIHDGQFTLDGEVHRLPVNDRGQTLHGGPDGFHRRNWHAQPLTQPGHAGVRLQLTSPHGDMGFPGEMTITVDYTLDTAGTLAIDYHAVTDRTTVVNLTNHAYFNLAGGGDILDHLLEVDADSYLPVDAQAIPLGPAEPVAGTPFDFTVAAPIGARIGEQHRQLLDAGGYDHCWILRPGDAGGLRRAASLTEPVSGRALEVWTTEPGLQVYTGNYLDGKLTGADGRRHQHRGAVCLETQHFPDSPNQPGYPSTTLRPGEHFRSRTEYRLRPAS